MKNVLMSCLVLFIGFTSVNAQNYKPFKLGLGIGYTMPKGGGGVLIDVEPAYRINDQIAVGLRIESAAMAKSFDGEEGSVSANGSYTVNGQYYLSDAKFRPYVGLGLGIFSIASISADANGDAGIAGGSEFGVYPRLGFDLGHFNINLDYNLIAASDGMNTAGEEISVKNSYLGIRIGAFIFGGQN